MATPIGYKLSLVSEIDEMDTKEGLCKFIDFVNPKQLLRHYETAFCTFCSTDRACCGHNTLNGPQHEKTNNLHGRKKSRRSAVQ